MHFTAGWHNRAVTMTTQEVFEPSPSAQACRWCSYKDGDNPSCEWGVK